jgi:peptidylprolyl isomerase
MDGNKTLIIVIVTVLLTSVLLAYLPKADSEENSETQNPLEENAAQAQVQVEILEEGNEDGKVVETGDTVKVHYIGQLEDGTVFDQNTADDEPYQFTVGEGGVIQGWDENLVGMRVGEKRKLVIPPEYGYGAQERPGIPANSTLIFEVELVEIVE